MRKIINNAFSTKMIQRDGLSVAHKIISEEEFLEQAHSDDSICVIGHPDTAELFGVKENRQTIVLEEGDVLFVAELNNSTGTRLPVGITQMEEIPDGFSFRFLKLVVFKTPFEF